MTIQIKIDLSYKIVLNLTAESWTTLHHEIQSFLDETTLHCVNDGYGFHLAGACRNYPNIYMFWRFPERKRVECIFIEYKDGEDPNFDWLDKKHMYK